MKQITSEHMRLPPVWASLINKINNHSPYLSLIGILPNHLRILLKKLNNDDDRSFEEINKTLFWSGYSIWNNRRKLMSNFWKHIAPDEWKSYDRLNPDSSVHNGCNNPFHFLKKHCDLSQKKPTPCQCSRVTSPFVSHSLDIRQFLISRKSDKSFLTREDLIRGAHDRDQIEIDHIKNNNSSLLF